MDDFHEMWVTSANNRWSNAYTIIVTIGCILVVACAFDKRTVRRRLMTCLVTMVFTWCAMEACSLTIIEKWRIRHEWGERHASHLTDQHSSALISDGANIVLGPVLFGARAFLILAGIGMGISIIRRSRCFRESPILKRS